MKNNFSVNTWLPNSSLRFIAIALLVLGIFFRFVSIDQKAYWYDETFTSIQLSGYSPPQAIDQIINGRVIGVEDLQKYQYPSSEKTVFDTINHLKEIEPQLTPLYFVIARFWEQLFGHSIAVIRSLSAVISLLVFPTIYWLCRELFRSSSVGYIAVALMAISPFHVLYAQEARPYSLWTVLILLSSASLLRAIRLPNKINWSVYALTLILALYSFLFSILVIVSHGLYILITQKFKLNKLFFSFTVASATSIIAFCPWIFVIINNPSRVGQVNQLKVQQQPVSLFAFMLGWVRNFSLGFIDFNQSAKSQLVNLIPMAILIILLLILIGYSIYFLSKKSQKHAGVFLYTLIAIPIIFLLLYDLILGRNQSSNTRYLIPSILGIQVAVAYLISSKIYADHLRRRLQWKIVFFTMTLIGLLSCISISQSNTWWTKADSNINHTLARIINQSNQPLVVSDYWFVNVISLSYELEKKVKFQLTVEPQLPKIATGFSNIFLYKPSQRLMESVAQDYNIQPIQTPWLLQLVQKE